MKCLGCQCQECKSEREALRARVAELEAERADIDRLAGERYTPVSLAAHVASTRYDWEMAHTLLDEMGVPGDMTLGDRIQALKL